MIFCKRKREKEMEGEEMGEEENEKRIMMCGTHASAPRQDCEPRELQLCTH